MVKRRLCVKRSVFLSSVKNVYEDISLDYIIALRDALNHLILDKVNDYGRYDDLIQNAKGYIYYEVNY